MASQSNLLGDTQANERLCLQNNITTRSLRTLKDKPTSHLVMNVAIAFTQEFTAALVLTQDQQKLARWASIPIDSSLDSSSYKTKSTTSRTKQAEPK